MGAASRKDAQAVQFRLTEADLVLFREFMEREGYTSVSTAARALILSGLEAFPRWGVRREERRGVYLNAKQRVMKKLLQAIHEIELEIEDEELLARNEAAANETQILNLETDR